MSTIYCTIADVRNALARDLSHLAANAASLADAQLQEACDDAGNQIDSALGYTFPTPFAAPVPRQIFVICRDIACYLADLTYRQNKEYGAAVNSPIPLRYKRAVDMLEDLRTGKANLIGWPPPGDVVDQPNPEGGTVVSDGFVGAATDLTEGVPYREPAHLGFLYPGPGGSDGWGRWW